MTTRLPDEMWRDATDAAERDGISFAQYTRRALARQLYSDVAEVGRLRSDVDALLEWKAAVERTLESHQPGGAP